MDEINHDDADEIAYTIVRNSGEYEDEDPELLNLASAYLDLAAEVRRLRRALADSGSQPD